MKLLGVGAARDGAGWNINSENQFLGGITMRLFGKSHQAESPYLAFYLLAVLLVSPWQGLCVEACGKRVFEAGLACESEPAVLGNSVCDAAGSSLDRCPHCEKEDQRPCSDIVFSAVVVEKRSGTPASGSQVFLTSLGGAVPTGGMSAGGSATVYLGDSEHLRKIIRSTILLI